MNLSHKHIIGILRITIPRRQKRLDNLDLMVSIGRDFDLAREEDGAQDGGRDRERESERERKRELGRESGPDTETKETKEGKEGKDGKDGPTATGG